MNTVDEKDDSLETEVERISAINPLMPDSVSQPDFVAAKLQPKLSTPQPAMEKKTLPERTASQAEASSAEPPHIYVETEEVRQARLDRQWKQLKLDLSELPDIYSRLSKIKLTGRMLCGFYCVKQLGFENLSYFIWRKYFCNLPEAITVLKRCIHLHNQPDCNRFEENC